VDHEDIGSSFIDNEGSKLAILETIQLTVTRANPETALLIARDGKDVVIG
jgi:hypothetical protein